MGDNLSAVFLGSGRYALQISGAFLEYDAGHRCALLENFDLKCWGKNWSGELGLGSVEVLGDASGEMESLLAIPLN